MADRARSIAGGAPAARTDWRALARRTWRARFTRAIGVARVPAVVSVPIILPYFWMVVIAFTARTGGVGSDVLWTACAVIVPAVLSTASSTCRWRRRACESRPASMLLAIAGALLVALVGEQLHLDNFRFLWRADFVEEIRSKATSGAQFPSVWTAFFNSLALALSQTVIILTVASLAGYYISRFAFRGRNAFLQGLLVLHAFPAMTLIIPIFLMLHWIGLLDTIAGVMLVLAAIELPFYVFVMKGFFDGVPWDIEMSAMTDGATRRQAFRLVVLPQVRVAPQFGSAPAEVPVIAAHGWAVRTQFQGGNIMGLRINQNIAAMNAYRNLSVTDGQMAKSLEKLSSGFRINRAADDAAGLAISEGLRSQVGGLKVAVRNAQDGISVVQTAEGALTETHSILQRMRDLAVQARQHRWQRRRRPYGHPDGDRPAHDELDRIANRPSSTAQKLLDGSNTTATFQVGANAGETISVDIAIGRAWTPGPRHSVRRGPSRGRHERRLPHGAAPRAPCTSTTGFDFRRSGEQRHARSVGRARPGRHHDYATGRRVDQGRMHRRPTADKAWCGNGTVGTVRQLHGHRRLEHQAGARHRGTASVQAAVGASAAITSIDAAINTVSTTRANLGAVQNRFEHTINNLNVAVENLSASESRIRDTDMASEMVNFTRSQILSQAGTAMLAQANQASQGVLRLLQ